MILLYAALMAPLPQQDAWSALPLPRICEERHFAGQPERIDSAGHVDLGETFKGALTPAEILFAPQDLGNLLQMAAGVGQRSVRVSPYSPPFYIQANAEDSEWAGEALDGISAACDRQFLQVTAHLVPGGKASDSPPAAPQMLVGGTDGTQVWQTELLSGEEVFLGSRHQESFVSSFDVEVSAQAGVAAPTIGQVTTGKTLHLQVSRVDGGRRYHMRGHLDLSELAGFTSFDPGTPDLGQFMQPKVHALSLSFSAVGELGERQRVVIEGAPLAEKNWALWIEVNGVAEPRGPLAAGQEIGKAWRAYDVSLIESRARGLASLSPGSLLEDTHALDAINPTAATISASGVLGMLQSSGRSRRSSGGAPGNAPHQVTKGLILVAAAPGDGGLATQVSSFLQSAEASRLKSAQVTLSHGALKLSFPTAAGEAARVWAGSEQVLVTGYRSEIAPSTWMPLPIVEHVRDGLAWQGALETRRFSSQAWIAETESIQIVNQKRAQLGAVQLPKRHIRSARKAQETSDSVAILMPGQAENPALLLKVNAPVAARK
jgi:hypothetical protein